MPARHGRHAVRRARRAPDGSRQVGRSRRSGLSQEEAMLHRLEYLMLIDFADGRGTPSDYAQIISKSRDLLSLPDLPRPLLDQALALRRLAEVAYLAAAPFLSPPAAPGTPGDRLPAVLAVGLGRFIAAHEPLPANWAFSWHAHLPDRFWRAPATRCPQEFGELFTAGYTRTYPRGMLVARWSQPLAFSYQTRHPRFDGRRVHLRLGLPDPARLGEEILELNTLAVRAQRDLEPYASYLGRHPGARGSEAARALLPPGLTVPEPTSPARVPAVTTTE